MALEGRVWRRGVSRGHPDTTWAVVQPRGLHHNDGQRAQRGGTHRVLDSGKHCALPLHLFTIIIHALSGPAHKDDFMLKRSHCTTLLICSSYDISSTEKCVEFAPSAGRSDPC